MFLADQIHRAVIKSSAKSWAKAETAYMLEGHVRTLNPQQFVELQRLILRTPKPAMASLFNALSRPMQNGQRSLRSQITDLAKKLKTALKYEFDPDVMNSVSEMAVLDDKQLLKAFRFIKLPVSPMWIEYSMTSTSLVSGFFLEEGEFNGEPCINAQIVGSQQKSKSIPTTARVTITIAASGFYSNGQLLAEHNKDSKVSFVKSFYDETIFPGGPCTSLDMMTHEYIMRSDSELSHLISANLIACSILLLNSRSKILKTVPLSQKSTMTSDEIEHLVQLDLDRLYAKNPKASDDQLRELRYTTLRTGHFQFRESGVYWRHAHPLRVTKPGNQGQSVTSVPSESSEENQTGMLVKDRFVSRLSADSIQDLKM